MNWLRIRLFGSFFSSFLPYSYGYEPANELKTVLKPPNSRFSPYSRQPPRSYFGMGYCRNVSLDIPAFAFIQQGY